MDIILATFKLARIFMSNFLFFAKKVNIYDY